MLHHISRLALAASVLLTGTAATAQTGPEIAYAKGGSRAEVYLINSDSSGQRLLYRGGSRTEIFHVDIRPGGGQLAIEEHDKSKSGSEADLKSTIKVIDYDSSGSLVGTIRSLPLTCLSGSVDYHPTDGTLLYRNCSTTNRIQRMDTATMASTDLALPHNAFLATWLDADNVLYYADGDTDSTANGKFWKVSMSTPGSQTPVGGTAQRGSLDPATSGTRVLVSGFSEVRLLNVTTGANGHLWGGNKGHYSPGDQDVIYITASTGGQYILIRKADGTGSPTNLVGKGNYTALDWRN